MNKIVVSIIFAVILILAIDKVTDVIFDVKKPEKSAYQVASITTSDSSETTKITSETSVSVDIMSLLTSADAAGGEKVFKKCVACHSIAKDGGNKIGPALWNVLGRKAGSLPNYKYSKAMSAHGKTWSFEEMNGFILKPKAWVKGTKMSFAGIKSEKDRASLILYLNKNTDNPLPLK